MRRPREGCPGEEGPALTPPSSIFTMDITGHEEVSDLTQKKKKKKEFLNGEIGMRTP